MMKSILRLAALQLALVAALTAPALAVTQELDPAKPQLRIVEPFGLDQIAVELKAGERLKIRMRGAEDGQLEAYLIGPAGELLGKSDVSQRGSSLVIWTEASGIYRLYLRNSSSSAAACRVLMN